MKKLAISALTISSLLLSFPLRAEQTSITPSEMMNPTSPPSEMPVVDSSQTENEEGTPVGEASVEGKKITQRKIWKNVGLAVVSVAFAITALILVSKNSGHSK